ncbi:serine hydrolase domain-containing protein [Spirosoma sp.]|uniref:serine hydrolase domain-containing protein n=1 Tax=Spirosoma sp. TaxID=1899569 RepID=UPI0026321EDB|nr:serine hydrolase domain-containing protein [Spirosoma sp.]MCX6212925.1 serine hydrolase [Spirosoma sp.]
MAQVPKRLDSVMRSMNAPTEPGAVLLVRVNGKTICRNGYGLANAKTKALITPETNFRMASISKQFTAMSILLLEKDGKLSVDDPLTRFFPEFNLQVGKKVRIRHLLTHTSGILDYEAVMNPQQREQLLDIDVLTLIKNRDSLYFEPGTQFRYSNSAYCLLALVIEKASGQSFASFIKQRIFQPLQMNQSTVYEAGRPIRSRAMGYRKEGGKFVFSDQSVTSATKGDGGVYTSLTDYKKWMDALETNKLLDLKAALARTGKAIPQTGDSFYGAGWFYRQPENPMLFHSGSTCGFNNYVVSIPSERFLMVCFSNKANNKPNALAIINILAESGYAKLADILALDDLTQ